MRVCLSLTRGCMTELEANKAPPSTGWGIQYDADSLIVEIYLTATSQYSGASLEADLIADLAKAANVRILPAAPCPSTSNLHLVPPSCPRPRTCIPVRLPPRTRRPATRAAVPAAVTAVARSSLPASAKPADGPGVTSACVLCLCCLLLSSRCQRTASASSVWTRPTPRRPAAP